MCDCNNENWKSYTHHRSMVYRPYYYTYYDYPYYESKYVSKNDKVYSPNTILSNKIKLNDGTTIEGFGYNNNFLFMIIAIVIGILIFNKK